MDKKPVTPWYAIPSGERVRADRDGTIVAEVYQVGGYRYSALWLDADGHRDGCKADDLDEAKRLADAGLRDRYHLTEDEMTIASLYWRIVDLEALVAKLSETR